MKRVIARSLIIFLFVGVISSFTEAELADKCFENLPDGCFVSDSIVVPRDQTIAIGQKLGVSLDKLSNTYLRIHGMQIQVNFLDTKTQTDATKLYNTISNIKSHPAFCLQIDKRVIEYVGSDSALAIKTSYELGFLEKPKNVRYRIKAQLATINKSDYMSFNKLFNAFIATDGKIPSTETMSEITLLLERFQFGNSLALRFSEINKSKAVYKFVPSPDTKKTSRDDVATYTFTNIPKKLGVPYVVAEMEISTNEYGLTPTTRKADKELLSSTEFWPCDDPEIVAIAKKITTGKQTTKEKVQAILEWLAPGKNIKFGGPVTGSRWGVKKVLKQKFGQCWDFSDCFVTLCRASGIPCRQVGGWLYGTSGHIWAEYLDEDKGWVQVDATGGGKLNCGIYHILYFTSETGEMPILYVSMPEIEIIATK